MSNGRPSSLKELDLNPFKTIKTDLFQKAFKGTLDAKGRASQSAGIEYAGCEYYLFIKKRRLNKMSEKAYEIGFISGTTCKDGRHFQELVCVAEDKKVIRILLPVSNMCEYMPFGDSSRCNDCEYQNECEMIAPYEIELGRKLVIVDKGEFVQDKSIQVMETV